MICENCLLQHNGEYGSGRFCSEKCARGFSTKSKRREINVEVGKKLRGRKGVQGVPTNPFKRGYDSRRPNLNSDFYLKVSETKRRKKEERLANISFDDLTLSEKKIKVLREQNGCCYICGIKEWLGELITLHYHHKDGNKNNETRNNVEFICPNCHSQTSNDTYKGRHHSAESKEKIKLGWKRRKELKNNTVVA